MADTISAAWELKCDVTVTLDLGLDLDSATPPRTVLAIDGSYGTITAGSAVPATKAFSDTRALAAGADALELNIYYLATKPTITGAEVEQMYVDLVRDIKQSIRIPIAVKLNPYFSAVANISRRLVGAGARGLVLFNRFYQPDFDIENRAIVPSLDLSTPSELRLRLRWVALLAGQVNADLAITGGVHSAEDVIKGLMAGASVTMMASALIQHGIDHLAAVTANLQSWLDSHAYASVGDIRGCLSHVQIGDSAALERANYLNVLRTARSKD